MDREAPLGRVEDLLSAAFEVFFADPGHGSKLKRMFVLDKRTGPVGPWTHKENGHSISWEKR
ncbi:Uncharacterised protein [Mycobacteroides abscessus subsp. abscessus]|nr:Uncharacterised protein [Mycobacteroides abscessus subsp. abscessus]